MTDFIIWDTAQMMAQYTDQKTKTRMAEIGKLLHGFLSENELFRSKKDASIGVNWGEFKLMSSNLTPDGLTIIRDGLDRWLASIDDLSIDLNIKSLERTRKKFIVKTTLKL